MVAVAVAAAAAAGVIDASSLIVAIEREGPKPRVNALRQCKGAAQADGHCVMHDKALPGERVGGTLVLPASKVDEKMMHQLTSTAGNKEVVCRRRR